LILHFASFCRIFIVILYFRNWLSISCFFSSFSITPPRRRKPCLGRNIEDSDADLYAEYHGGKTPESTSSSEFDGSYLDRCRSLERRSEKNRLALERPDEFLPDLASTINTDFASISPRCVTYFNNFSNLSFTNVLMYIYYASKYKDQWRCSGVT